MRRTKINQNGTQNNGEFNVKNLKINSLKHKIFVNGIDVEFSATEFAILQHLAQHAGQVFSRQQIITAIKGSDYPVTERAIDVQILGIRKKLEDAGCYNLIETIRGVGYRMCEDNNES